MEQCIAAYYKKTIPIIYLIDNLEALTAAMKNISKAWKTAVAEEFHRMDVTYASMLDYGRESFTNYEREIFEKHIANIVVLIEQFKTEHTISTTTSPLIYPK